MGTIIQMSRTGLTDGDGNFDWPNAVIDAGIAASLAFFTTLAGLGVAGLFADPYKAICAAGISAGTTFFTWLALKRGIVKQE